MGTDSCDGIRNICANTVKLMDEMREVAASTNYGGPLGKEIKRTAGNVCAKALPARSKLKRCLPGRGGAGARGYKGKRPRLAQNRLRPF